MALYNSTTIPPKPSRPFTEYHVFFQLERNFILQTSDGKSADIDPAHLDGIIDGSGVDPHAAARPPRYRPLILPSGWHTKGTRPKCRSHRKNHGKITFVELSKLISRRWKEADDATRSYCRGLAEMELRRYREEMRDYVEQYGERAILQSVKTGKKGGRGQRGGKGKKTEEDGKLNADQETENEKRLIKANLAVLKNAAFNEKNVVAPAAPVPQDTAMLYPNLFGTGVQKMHAVITPQVAASSAVPGDLTAQYHNIFGAPQQVASHRMTYPVPAQKGLARPLYPHMFFGTAAPPQANIQVPAAPHALVQLYQQHQMESNMLDLSHELQNRNIQMQLMNSMQSLSQAMKPQPMMNQVMIPQATPPHESTQLINPRHFNGSKNTMVWTTMKDEGPLPLLSEDEEYHVSPLDVCHDTCHQTSDPLQVKHQPLAPLSPQGKHQFAGVLDSLDSHAPPVSQFDDDCSIVGPMSIMPNSPPGTPPPPPAAYPNSLMGSPANNNNIRAKSISPVPEYSIAPEISFLAKNFVNEFSRYLNHDHDVQKSELEALDHQDKEKEALSDMLANGSQENRGGDTLMIGKGSDSIPYTFKRMSSTTFLPEGSHDSLPSPVNNGMCLPVTDDAHELSKTPSKGHDAQQPFFCHPCHAAPKSNKSQLFDDHSSMGSNVSRNSSLCDFQAWLDECGM